jgi:predicted membrane protein
LIIIVAVIYFIANDHRSRASERRVTDSTFSANAFLSGVEQDIESSEFRGGDASVFMGGAEVDLRRTTMLSDEATIDLSVMMGGMEIRVPRDWTVVNRITPVLGGVKNETRSTPGGKRIVLKGSVVMGGVEIKN